MYRSCLLLLSLLFYTHLHAREWDGMRQYTSATGIDTLAPGHWLKSDRKNNTTRWKQANVYNLQQEDGYRHYETFAEKRDFYAWFDEVRKDKGYDIKWAGVANLITRKLVYLDYWAVRFFIIRSKAFTQFIRQSNSLIMENIYPDLRALYNNGVLQGQDARHWDSVTIYKEQCIVLDTLYRHQPEQVLRKFNRMANGKGLYSIVVPKDMRMNGNVRDCKVRLHFGLVTMVAYYNEQQQ